MLNENKENKEISQKFKNLPDDILFLILSYDNKLKYRNGKWMNQILLEDSRRECIKKMIKPILEKNGLEEVTIDYHTINTEVIALKDPNVVYHEMYKKAREKAKQCRLKAVEAYLEAEQIKTKYMLFDIDDDDSDDSDEENYLG